MAVDARHPLEPSGRFSGDAESIRSAAAASFPEPHLPALSLSRRITVIPCSSCPDGGQVDSPAAPASSRFPRDCGLRSSGDAFAAARGTLAGIGLQRPQPKCGVPGRGAHQLLEGSKFADAEGRRRRERHRQRVDVASERRSAEAVLQCTELAVHSSHRRRHAERGRLRLH